MLRFLGNLLWLIAGGVLIGLGYLLGGVLLCLTLIGIPFGLQAIKLGLASFAPFGREVVAQPTAGSALTVVFNVLWVVLLGWMLALVHLVLGLALLLTLIGIPFGLQHFKLLPLALVPFGREFRGSGGREVGAAGAARLTLPARTGG
jgi:uncharacterized membrane protein YccF (DUF307 family)